MNPRSIPLNRWTERYEALRRHFLEDRHLLGWEPMGLLFFFRTGLAQWMKAWRWKGGEPQRAIGWPLPPGPSAPAGVEAELTRLIAHMTAGHLPRALAL